MKNTTKKKKIRIKPLAIDLLFIICGLVIGEVIASLTQDVGFLKWLSYDVAFGFQEPLSLTFVIFKVAFGFSIHLNPANVLFGLLGFAAGRYFRAPSAPKKAELGDYEDDEQ